MSGFKYRGELCASGDGPISLPPGHLFERLVTIAIFKEPFYAYLSKTALAAEGIECCVSDKYATASNSLFARVKSGYRLRVRESEAAKAVKLLLQEPVEE